MLKESIAKFLKLDSLVNNLTGYVETRIELLKLELKEDLAKGLAKAAVYAGIAFMATFFLFFISLACAYKLSESVGTFGGFAIVSGVYVLIGIVLLGLRDRISKWLETEFRQLLKQKKK